MDEQAAAQQAHEPTSGTAPATEQRVVRLPTAPQPAGSTDAPAGADDHLTREEAEQVIRRALELQDAQEVGSDPALSLADVHDIARQLGLDPALVRRARSEVELARQGGGGHGEVAPAVAEKLLGPRHVAGARLVPADPAPVRAATGEWMTNDEGMTRTGRRGQAERWVRDRRLLVQLRRGLQNDRGSGVLRDLDAVSVTVSPDVEGTIVRVEADTTKVRTAGGVVAAAGTVISAGIGVGVAAVMPDAGPLGADAAQFTVAFLPALAVGLSTTLAVTRTWTAKVRRAVDQALDGITMTLDEPQPPLPPAPTTEGWRSTAVRWLGGQR